MEIAVFIICTGKYNIFFDKFYESSEKYFLPEYKKTYYVFTDGNIIKRGNIKRIQQEKIGWPYDTMYRFKMFNSIKNIVIKKDYAFFFNVNMEFVDYIGNEILPGADNSYLVGVNHPGFYNKNIDAFPYERNEDSVFYIPFGSGSNYYQGCLNGGRTTEYMEMSEKLDHMIGEDLGNGIIPEWWDESALNWYYDRLETKPLMLPPSYAYPESQELGIEEKKIIQIDKEKKGGHNFLRFNT